MDKALKYFVLFLTFMIVLLAGYIVWSSRSHDERVRDLQNEIAARDVTIRVKDQVYERLAQDQNRLEKKIDTSTSQGAELQERMKELKGKVAFLSSALFEATAKLDKALTPKEGENGTWYADIDEKNGPLFLRGRITTGPTSKDPILPRLDYGIEDLKLDLVVTHLKDGSWKADAAVPSPVKLAFSSVRVDSDVLKPRWYQRFSFSLNALANKSDAFVSAGAGYRYGIFNPSFFIAGSTAGDNHIYYGIGLTVFPWEN